MMTTESVENSKREEERLTKAKKQYEAVLSHERLKNHSFYSGESSDSDKEHKIENLVRSKS